MASPARIPVRQEGEGGASVGRTGAGVKAPNNSMQRTALRAAADAWRSARTAARPERREGIAADDAPRRVRGTSSSTRATPSNTRRW